MKCFVRGYKGQGFGSGFIKWWTRSEYSHVSLVFHMHGAQEEVESIQGCGVIRHAPYKACHKDFVELAVPLSEEQVIDAHILALSLIGARYDWKGIVSFLLRRTKHSRDKWFCSEFVAYVMHKVKRPITRREPYRESPDNIMESFRLIAPADEQGGA